MQSDPVAQIKDLVLGYADALNLYDLEAFGDTFAEDGVWDVTPYFKGEGRQGVVSVFATQQKMFSWVYQVVHGTRVLKIEGDRAWARSTIVEYGNRHGTAWFLLGVYHDECARQGDRWRFLRRRFDPLYMGPPDLSASPALYPAPRHF